MGTHAATHLHCCWVVHAAACMAQSYYLCPGTVTFDCDVAPHLSAYWPALVAAAAGVSSTGGSSRLAELADVLCAYIQATNVESPSVVARAQLAQHVMEQLSQPFTQAAISRQLQQLAAGQQGGAAVPFTVEQLHEACVLRLHIVAKEAWPAAGAQPSREVRALMQAAGSAMAQLHPDNFARINFSVDPVVGLQREIAVQELLRGVELARQQRSDLWQCRHAALALNLAAHCVAPLQPTLLARAAAAFQHAELALQRCSRLLPAEWTQLDESLVSIGQRLLPSIRARAMLSGPSSRDEAAVAAIRHIIAQSAEPLRNRPTCSGCGKQAVGLRTCARCRAARYCSRECQAAHWPQHKHDCKPT